MVLLFFYKREMFLKTQVQRSGMSTELKLEYLYVYVCKCPSETECFVHFIKVSGGGEKSWHLLRVMYNSIYS